MLYSNENEVIILIFIQQTIITVTPHIMHQIVAIVLFVALIQLNYACYITNCPIGGKRSLSSGNQLSTHQCPRCGINGQCFGPSICCTDLACRIGHPSDTRQCSMENHSLLPCAIKTPTCAAVSNGRCAARGICCNAESCQVDETCAMSQNDNSNEERLEQQPRVMLL